MAIRVRCRKPSTAVIRDPCGSPPPRQSQLGFVSKADFSRRPVSLRSVFFESRRDSTTVLRQSLEKRRRAKEIDQSGVHRFVVLIRLIGIDQFGRRHQG